MTIKLLIMALAVIAIIYAFNVLTGLSMFEADFNVLIDSRI